MNRAAEENNHHIVQVRNNSFTPIHAGDPDELLSNHAGVTDTLVTINVSGLKFQTRRSTLHRFPDTLLGSDELEQYYMPEIGEYFFDRNRGAFETILFYYQSNGIICLPFSVNPDIFLEELAFFKLGEKVIKKFKTPIVLNTIATSEGGESVFFHPAQRKAWMLFDDPDSSVIAKSIAYFDLVIILFAVITQCIESLPEIRLCKNETDTPTLKGNVSMECNMLWNSKLSVFTMIKLLEVIEIISNVWFTINFLVRIISCPDKKDFVTSLLNWFDVLAIFPFYIDLLLIKEENLQFLMVLRFFRTMRIVRVFKMSRYFQGLFALGHALKSSAGELVVLAMMLITFVVLYSSLVFFTEKCDPSKTENCKGKFDSIIRGFWWSVVTMSTVGYGDYVPLSSMGQVVGTLCVLTGILVISLPFPIIITNFNRFMRVRSSKSRVYATIENGMDEEQHFPIPEYNGIAYGFFTDADLVPATIMTSGPREPKFSKCKQRQKSQGAFTKCIL